MQTHVSQTADMFISVLLQYLSQCIVFLDLMAGEKAFVACLKVPSNLYLSSI